MKNLLSKITSPYKSWKETKDILGDKDLLHAIRSGEMDIKEGRYIMFEELKKEIAPACRQAGLLR